MPPKKRSKPPPKGTIRRFLERRDVSTKHILHRRTRRHHNQSFTKPCYSKYHVSSHQENAGANREEVREEGVPGGLIWISDDEYVNVCAFYQAFCTVQLKLNMVIDYC